jgi:hypothetical protein
VILWGNYLHRRYGGQLQWCAGRESPGYFGPVDSGHHGQRFFNEHREIHGSIDAHTLYRKEFLNEMDKA